MQWAAAHASRRWSEPVQRALSLGQVEIVLMALVTWDLCQPDRRRWKGAATGIAAGVSSYRCCSSSTSC
jgi:hypothetical protein